MCGPLLLNFSNHTHTNIYSMDSREIHHQNLCGLLIANLELLKWSKHKHSSWCSFYIMRMFWRLLAYQTSSVVACRRFQTWQKTQMWSQQQQDHHTADITWYKILHITRFDFISLILDSVYRNEMAFLQLVRSHCVPAVLYGCVVGNQFTSYCFNKCTVKRCVAG